MYEERAYFWWRMYFLNLKNQPVFETIPARDQDEAFDHFGDVSESEIMIRHATRENQLTREECERLHLRFEE